MSNNQIWTPERKEAQIQTLNPVEPLKITPLVVQIPCGNDFGEDKIDVEKEAIFTCNPQHLCDNCRMMQLLGQFLTQLIDPNGYGNMCKKAVRNRARQLLGMEILEP